MDVQIRRIRILWSGVKTFDGDDGERFADVCLFLPAQFRREGGGVYISIESDRLVPVAYSAYLIQAIRDLSRWVETSAGKKGIKSAAQRQKKIEAQLKKESSLVDRLEKVRESRTYDLRRNRKKRK